MKPKTKAKIIFFCASIIFILLCIYTLKNMSYTDNEPIYIMAGYYYITEGETFYTGHPILTHIISALPLLFIEVDTPDPAEIYHPFEFSRKEWLYYGDNNPDQIIFLARLPFIFLSLVFAWYLFRWTRELFGLVPGAVALFFYIFNPDIIWNSVVVMTDMAVAGFMFISCYYLWKYLKEEKKRHLILTGIFFGLAISSKSTALFILPVYLAMFILYRKKDLKKILKDSVYIGLIAILLFSLMGLAEIAPIYNQENPFYFKYEGSRSDERLQTLAEDYTENELFQKIIIVSLRDIPLAGASSIQAYVSQFKHAVDGHAQYFLGEYNQHGVWYYYLGGYLIKTPIVLLLSFALSFVFWKKLKAKDWKDELTLLLPIGITLIIFSLILRLNLGLRHTLLILLFMMLCAAKVYQWEKWKSKIWKWCLGIFLIWYMLSSLIIAPYYIPYFNEFVGQNNGPEYMLDTSVDLGQDLINLKEFMDTNNITEVKLRYGGFENATERNISYTPLTSCEPEKGIYAISVNVLYGQFWHEGIKPDFNFTCYAWLREMEPIERIGYSIYIYNITETDIDNI